MNPTDLSLFSELYTFYYHVVARILKEAAFGPVTRCQIQDLAGACGSESAIAIVPRLIRGDWPFLRPMDTAPAAYTSVLKNPPFPQPLTRLQKSWLKALTKDSRIRLFFTDMQLKELDQYLSDTAPLFRPQDFSLFDQYKDHDPFSSDMYRRHMHIILDALRQRQFLSVDYLSRKNHIITRTWLPCRLEYGQRDGKFRLYAMTLTKTGRQKMDILNAARIVSVKKTDSIFPSQVDVDRFLDRSLCKEPLVLEITTQRNALERAMLHFSCYQKKVERLENSGTYRCTIYYDRRWETELLIQVLSFGPVVKVLEPESFLRQIQERVRKQNLPEEN